MLYYQENFKLKLISMLKKTLLLQFRTDESRVHEQELVMKFGHFSSDNMEILNALDGDKVLKPEDLDNYNGVITGASGQFNVTDWSDEVRTKIERFYPFLREVVKRDFPMLAICFGHQLLAHMFGGKVETDKSQAEVGTVPVYFTEEGRNSKLLKGISDPFMVVSAHKDSVTRLPEGAKLMAYSDRCKYISYKLGNNVFCTQFHAELDLDALMWRLTLYPEYMMGKSEDEIRSEYQDTPDTPKIIKNFHEMVTS